MRKGLRENARYSILHGLVEQNRNDIKPKAVKRDIAVRVLAIAGRMSLAIAIKLLILQRKSFLTCLLTTFIAWLHYLSDTVDLV